MRNSMRHFVVRSRSSRPSRSRHSMRPARLLRTAAAALAALALTAGLAGCADSNSIAGQQVTGPTIRIGIKFDQPGLSLRDGAHYSGFDVDVAEYVANKLGYSPRQIQWVQATSSQRETLLSNGQVDFVISSYSIDQSRKKLVDFAGPYFVAGQDLLVRKSDTSIKGPQDLDGKKLCTASGSTSAQVIKQNFSKNVQVMELNGYAECVTALESGTVDAVSTDDIILATLAAAKGGGYLKVVGKPFTKETYGIGVRKGSVQLKSKINAALRQMISSGTWKKDLDQATKGTGYKPNPAWNPPTAMNAADSDHDVSHFISAKGSSSSASASSKKGE